MSLIIRRATATDIDALTSLLEALFAIEEDFTADPQKQRSGLRLLIDSDKGCVMVAEDNGEIVGMVTLQTLISTAEGGPVGLLEDMIVAAPWRGRGIGRRLLEAIEEWAAKRGLLRLQLLADRNNRPALDFYQRLDWQGTRLLAMRKNPSA